jgi:hypothetical protein
MSERDIQIGDVYDWGCGYGDTRFMEITKTTPKHITFNLWAGGDAHRYAKNKDITKEVLNCGVEWNAGGNECYHIRYKKQDWRCFRMAQKVS